MKKILFIVSLFALTAFSVNAQSVAVGSNMAAGATPTVVSTPAVIQSITLSSTNTVPSILYLIDGSLTVTNKAWTNLVFTAQSVVSTWINSGGTTNYQTNTVLKSTSTAHAAATVNKTPVAVVTVPPNNALITIDDPILIGQALIFSNSAAGVSYTVNYRSP